LFDRAMADKLALTDAGDKKITGEELKKILTGMDTIRFVRPLPPYDEFDTVVFRIYDPESVRTLRFKEEWTYTPATMEISKKVLAYAPVEETYDEFGLLKGKRPLFWVNLNKQKATGKEKLLTQRISTHTSFYPYIGSSCFENKDRAGCYEYLNELFTKAFKNELKIYDGSSDINSGNLVPETGADLDRYINRSDTFRLTRNFPPYNEYDSVITEDFDPDSLRMTRFYEEWTIDTETMYLVKKVTGIAIIQEDYDAVTGEFRGWRRLFDVYFNDIWLPFDKKIEIKK
jgi:hypothetical protein